jgi:hypothetical protein
MYSLVKKELWSLEQDMASCQTDNKAHILPYPLVIQSMGIDASIISCDNLGLDSILVKGRVRAVRATATGRSHVFSWRRAIVLRFRGTTLFLSFSTYLAILKLRHEMRFITHHGTDVKGNLKTNSGAARFSVLRILQNPDHTAALSSSTHTLQKLYQREFDEGM